MDRPTPHRAHDGCAPACHPRSTGRNRPTPCSSAAGLWAAPAIGSLSTARSVTILLLVVGVTPTGKGMLENSPADTTQLPTGCQPESLAKPARRRAQGNPPAAAYAPRELDDHSFEPEDIASMLAALEAALGQLGLIERNDLATPSRAGGRRTRLQLTGKGRNHPPGRASFSLGRR